MDYSSGQNGSTLEFLGNWTNDSIDRGKIIKFFNSLVADWRTFLRLIEVKPLPESNSLQVSKHFGIKKICKKLILTFQSRK